MKTLRLLLALVFLALGASPAMAETVLVRAGRLVDVVAGRVLNDQLVRIEDGRVVSVAAFPATAPEGALVDWSAYTVVPGLMDMHPHQVGDITSSNVAAPLMSSQGRDVLLGVSHARDTLMAGFTTVRDVGAYRAFGDVALRDAINEGIVPGPRMYVAGAYVTVTKGGGEVTGLSPDVAVPPEFRRGVADNETEIRQRVRELVAGGADRGIHQAAAVRRDLGRLLAEQPARHVEVVDRHVAEQAAGSLHIRDRRR